MKYTINLEFTEGWVYATVPQITWHYDPRIVLSAHTLPRVLEHVSAKIMQHRLLTALFGKITPHE